jgi:hypothetical protein
MLGCIPTKHPINDVCFSPDGKNAVIATGSYDGGWCFEGYLLRFFYRRDCSTKSKCYVSAYLSLGQRRQDTGRHS